MVNHIVLWQYTDAIPPERRAQLDREIKEGLEALAGVIDGIVSIRVAQDPLPGSNVDIALISRFESAEALAAYIVHPAHQRMGEIIKPVVKERRCVDYEE